MPAVAVLSLALLASLVQDPDGLTPLMRAAARGDVKVVGTLLAQGADPNAATPAQKVTALMCAAYFGRLDAIKTLIARGAKIEIKDAQGAAAVDWAALGDHPELEALLTGPNVALNPFLNTGNMPMWLMDKAAQSAPDLPPVEWTHYAGTAASQKYSPLDQITAANVSRLRIAWRWASPDNAIVKEQPLMRPGMYQDTPLMVGGTLYTVTSLGIVAAVDPATGQTRWVFDPESWKTGRPGNLGFVHRGLAYARVGDQERLLLGTGDAYLLSIDARTGRLDPAFGTGGRVDLMEGVAHAVRATNYAVSAAPVVCQGVVVIGASIHDGPTHKEWPRGDVSGFDVKTGKRLWTLHSIPQKGEFGHDTWLGDAASYTGSTNVWTNMSADETLGLVYLPFGTATNDFYGGHRHGDNLFAESLVALDARTGRRAWHFQMVHHGVWDYDPPTAPMLVDLRVNGRVVQAVAQLSKQGFTYVFDRRTGAPVWPIEERPVPQSSVPGEKTAPTQPFPTRPPAYERQGFTDADLIDFTPELHAQAKAVVADFDRGPLFTPPSERGTVAVPGWVGGANWGGGGFDPETGTVFVPSITSPSVLQLLKPDASASNLLFRRGGVMLLPTVDGLPVVKPPYSRVTAIDLHRGEIRWMQPLGEGPRTHARLAHLDLPPLGAGYRGAPLVTKSLLFVAMGQGSLGSARTVPVAGQPLSPTVPPEPQKLVALDKATGALLWSDSPSGRPLAAPMTFRHQGVQYIVVATGLGPTAELVAYTLER